jgi:multidrug efflux pump subunit AcrB
MAITVAMMAGHGVAVRAIPKGFIPDQDTGQSLGLHRRARRGSASTRLVAHQKAVMAIVTPDPRDRGFTSSRSGRAARPPAPTRGLLFMR